MFLTSSKTLLLRCGGLLCAMARKKRRTPTAGGLPSPVGAGGETGTEHLPSLTSTLETAGESTTRAHAGGLTHRHLEGNVTCTSEAQHHGRGQTDEKQPFSLNSFHGEKLGTMKLVLDGASLFIGGGAGVGKSFVLRSIVTALRGKGLRVAVTASTGIAALNIGGTTFHSTFGVPITSVGDDDVWRTCALTILKRNGNYLASVDAIVIDEVSLLHSGYLEALDIAARAAPGKARHLPFGGIQLILSGDFMQLTPNSQNHGQSEARVVDGTFSFVKGGGASCSTTELSRSAGPRSNNVKGKVFESTLVDRCVAMKDCTSSGLMFQVPLFLRCLIHFQLCESRRHQDDAELQKDLNELRRGVLTRRMLRSALINKENLNAIRLYPSRRSVVAFNDIKMLELSGEEHFFQSVVELTSLLSRHSSPKHEGKAVIFVHNEMVVLHFRKGPRHNSSWPREVEKLVERVCARCVFKNRPILMMTPVTSRKQKHLRVFVRFHETRQIGTVSPVTIMKREWERSFRRNTSEGKATRALFGNVLFEVRHTDPSDLSLCSSLKRTYSKIIESDNVLQSKRLKVGCRVMLLRNLNNKYVNGSIGTVVSFQPISEVHHLLPTGIRIQLSRRVYASLAELKQTKDSDFTESAAGCPRGGDEAPQRDVVNRNDVIVPVVRMDADGKEVAIPWLSLSVGGVQETALHAARIVTMPLTLAYAFTVHKVQGLTLSHPVLLDCKCFFPCDHIIYVAASRVKKFSQLRMINVSPRMVTVHSGALKFSSSLPTVAEAVGVWKRWKKSRSATDSSKALGATCSSGKELSLYCATWKDHP